MSFLFFKKENKNNKQYYVFDEDEFVLAGNKNGLIYHTWCKKGKPLQGWSATADELLQTYTSRYPNDVCSGDSHALIIDFHPKSKDRIGLVELDRIHVYTYGDEEDIEWSPMMWELRKVYYEEGIADFTTELKQKLFKEVEVKESREKFIEFLYLKGDDYSWNWGKNGMTNAVFLDEEARDFFRPFF